MRACRTGFLPSALRASSGCLALPHEHENFASDVLLVELEGLRAITGEIQMREKLHIHSAQIDLVAISAAYSSKRVSVCIVPSCLALPHEHENFASDVLLVELE